MPTVLDQLRGMTSVVADTGALDAVRKYQPVDCTTNPSLVLKAFESADSKSVLDAEIARGREKRLGTEAIAANLPIALGIALSHLIKGRISTEVEANLSFDTAASVARAMEIVQAYDARGVGKDRILIKLAATWEGIRAAEVLQKEGVDCNLTLVFSLTQAIACADAGTFLISPFVGRITDWFKKSEGVDRYNPAKDPGVLSVKTIYDYYKSNGIDTIIMGASFRNVGQIKALSGCDKLTISPTLLEELASETADLPRSLSPKMATPAETQAINAGIFRWNTAMDPMANEQLASGIRGFDKDFKTMLGLLSNLGR
jgi:transaldolase